LLMAVPVDLVDLVVPVVLVDPIVTVCASGAGRSQLQ
jgi:hypothetical protein